MRPTRRINIQLCPRLANTPTRHFLREIGLFTLSQLNQIGELTLRIVDVSEMTALNQTYRQKVGPTNILSFPYDADEMFTRNTLPYLGDIALCADIVSSEADVKKIHQETHWAHLIIHGILHLIGHDHSEEHQANLMEKEEVRILNLLGYPNPYSMMQQGI
jgi:probable rRNA maturation factor